MGFGVFYQGEVLKTAFIIFMDMLQRLAIGPKFGGLIDPLQELVVASLNDLANLASSVNLKRHIVLIVPQN